MNKIITTFILSIGFFFVPQADAALSPVAVSIVPPVQFPPSDFDVTGVRASVLWGRHRDIYGVDLGLIGNITEQTFVGVALAGGFNHTKGQVFATGLQGAGIANVNTNKVQVYGVQLAGVVNVNTAESTIGGLQVALVNVSGHTAVYGVQLGLYNKAKSIHGLQIGVINDTQNLHGVQIGLLNFNHTGLFVVSPILNVGF